MGIANSSLSLFKRDIFIFVMNIVSSIVIARVLGPESLGVWLIYQMIPTYAEAFGRLKFDVGAIYFLGKNKYTLSEMLFFLNIIAILSALLMVGLAILAANLFDEYLLSSRGLDWNVMLLVLLYIPIFFITMNYKYISIFKDDTKTYNAMLISESVLSPFVGLIFLLVFDLGIFGMALGMLIGGLTAFYIGVFNVHKQCYMKISFSLTLLRDMWSYCMSLYITGLINQINLHASQLLVAYFLSPAYVAYLNLGRSRAEIANKIPGAIGTILYPTISKYHNNNEAAEKLSAKSFRVSYIIMTISGIIGSIFIYPFTIYLYGEEFLPLTTVFWIMMPAVIIYGSSTVFTQYFLGVGRPKISLWISMMVFIPQLITSYILVLNYGLLGGAIAAAITLILIAALTIKFFNTMSGISLWRIMIPEKSDFVIVGEFIYNKLNFKLARSR